MGTILLIIPILLLVGAPPTAHGHAGWSSRNGQCTYSRTDPALWHRACCRSFRRDLSVASNHFP
jgi:hypothetical protein